MGETYFLHNNFYSREEREIILEGKKILPLSMRIEPRYGAVWTPPQQLTDSSAEKVKKSFRQSGSFGPSGMERLGANADSSVSAPSVFSPQNQPRTSSKKSWKMSSGTVTPELSAPVGVGGGGRSSGGSGAGVAMVRPPNVPIPQPIPQQLSQPLLPGSIPSPVGQNAAAPVVNDPSCGETDNTVVLPQQGLTNQVDRASTGGS